ncbi:hypothetical protein BLNAU_9736 [Blattamonas nauphoetae]|uniref:4Fe-4S ferredoxin-type domain-containing protein n=1 Tax=Blattamonas nauphoetae TaxID=2049346 RepID=A0ABQ9XV35_9EUKA|nr:hypothetical protein BLNAU_9736 [Blattamonas nauphoetae]
MKIVILYFSNTGSTKSMATTFQKHLESANHTVTLHDGFAILKQYMAAGEKEVTPLLSKYHDSLRDADVVGIGSYVSYGTIADGAAKLLTEQATPTALFASMKFYFSFSSFGSFPLNTTSFLATYLHQRNADAKYLGSIAQHDPENYLPLLPPRGSIDGVRDSALKKVDDFGKDLVSRLNGGALPPMHKMLEKTPRPANMKPGTSSGTIKIDSEKCIKCYKCVTVCPYNALAKPEEGAAVKIPVWDADMCYGCGRCFNYCPVRAIEFPKVKTEEKEQYYWGRQDKNLKINKPPSRVAVISRVLPIKKVVIPLALVACVGLFFVTRKK